MSRRNRRVVVKVDPFAETRKSLRDDYAVAMANGVRQRAATFVDRKRKANREACRGRVLDG